MAAQRSRRVSFMQGAKDGTPIFLGYLSVSFAFGIMATESGLSAWIAQMISMTNLTSAGQVAGTVLMVSGASLVEIAMTTLVINLRYTLMSLSLSQKLDSGVSVWKRLLLSFGITDEIFAVAMQQSGAVGAAYLAGLIFTPYLGWAGGTFLGATAADLLPLGVRSALGIAIYGMFLAIIIPPAKAAKPIRFTVVLAVLFSCIFRFVPGLRRLSGGWVIILCAVAVSSAAALRYPVDEKEEKEEEGR